ncbi:MAG: MFS transporter [Chloroflexota bacterium]
MTPSSEKTTAFEHQSRSILIALIFPVIALLFNGSVFGIALPTIRDHFAIEPDVVAWLAIAFSLPFMVMMPLYGRLGDQLGRSRLLVFGIIILSLGTILIFVAESLFWVFVGRVVQGFGSAGITPLCLAIISSRFPEETRGRALGIWNATAPGTSIFAPTIGGFLIDAFGWRLIFPPIFVLCVVAVVIVRRQVPTLRGRPNWAILRQFDWGGVFFLNGLVIFLVLFLSSRPITGVEPLRDWRLLLGFLGFTAVFFIWERHQLDPLINLRLFKNPNFTFASLASGFRMGMMAGPGFLFPLYLTDLYGFNAAQLGLFATVHSIILLVLIRVGGNMADSYSRRNLTIVGISGQLLAMIYFAFLPASVDLALIYAGLIFHGAAAGLNIISLHRKALDSVDENQSGAAAGIYSMTRFGGSMIATTLIGVVLQWGEQVGLTQIESYQAAFYILVGYGILGLICSFALQKKQN